MSITEYWCKFEVTNSHNYKHNFSSFLWTNSQSSELKKNLKNLGYRYHRVIIFQNCKNHFANFRSINPQSSVLKRISQNSLSDYRHKIKVAILRKILTQFCTFPSGELTTLKRWKHILDLRLWLSVQVWNDTLANLHREFCKFSVDKSIKLRA